jgi:cyclophilin family peptidyl-prolyl cis-trans isomerase
MRQPLSLVLSLAACGLLSLAGCGESASNNVAASSDNAASVPGTEVALQDNPIPHVLISTSLGDIKVKLDHEKAPLTVENFLKYVEEGFYTDTIFHEVRQGDVIIGGGYTRDLKEKPTGHPPVRNEAHNGLKNTRGTIAMVRQPNVIDSSTSQFFFNLGANSDYLDPIPLEKDQQPELFPEKYGYCVFGEVVSGLEVLDEIAQQEVSDNGGVFQFLPKRLVVVKDVRRVK